MGAGEDATRGTLLDDAAFVDAEVRGGSAGGLASLAEFSP
jgi:hypothetical protein